MSTVLLVGRGAPDRGGIASYLDTLLGSDLARAHDLRFLNLSRPAVRRSGALSAANVRRTLEDLVAVWRMSAGCDIVHFHSALVPAVTIVRAGLIAFVARMRGARVIIHAHGGRLQLWLVGPVRRWLLRATLVWADALVAVSEATHTLLAGALPRTDVRFVPNGVDTHRFTPTPHSHDPPRVLYVGLLTPRKGVLDLVEASEELTRQNVRHELLVVGGTPDEGATAEGEVRRAAGPRVRMLGHREPAEMAEIYHQADVFCLPSWWEAMPLSVLEAMASQLCVVVTDVGDVGRMVHDGVHGRVVPARDVPALTAALQDVLCDPTRRDTMGRAGRQHVEAKYGLDVSLRHLDHLYAAVLDKGRRADA